MKDLVLCVPEDAFFLEPGRYDLLFQKGAGASGWYVNPDGTVNTYHNCGTWSSVDEYEADASELGRQIVFPAQVVFVEIR